MHRPTPTIFNWHITVYFLGKVQRDLSNNSSLAIQTSLHTTMASFCRAAFLYSIKKVLRSSSPRWHLVTSRNITHIVLPSFLWQKRGSVTDVTFWFTHWGQAASCLPNIWLFRETTLFSSGKKPSLVTMLCSRVWKFSGKLLKTQSSVSQ